jgi:hypothetical protein
MLGLLLQVKVHFVFCSFVNSVATANPQAIIDTMINGFENSMIKVGKAKKNADCL